MHAALQVRGDRVWADEMGDGRRRKLSGPRLAATVSDWRRSDTPCRSRFGKREALREWCVHTERRAGKASWVVVEGGRARWEKRRRAFHCLPTVATAVGTSPVAVAACDVRRKLASCNCPRAVAAVRCPLCALLAGNSPRPLLAWVGGGSLERGPSDDALSGREGRGRAGRGDTAAAGLGECQIHTVTRLMKRPAVTQRFVFARTPAH